MHRNLLLSFYKGDSSSCAAISAKPMVSSSTLSDRRGVWAFVLGVIMVTGGVLMHAPMFLMGRHNHFVLAGMPIGWDMILGMVGDRRRLWRSPPTVFFPGTSPANSLRQQDIIVTPPEDAPLSGPHWGLMSVLVIALIIDIMKPATLGFTLPGMMTEYHVTKATVSSFPFSALDGNGHRLGHLGRARRHLRAEGDDPAVRRDVRRNVNLRRDALPRLERGHVLHDGRCRRRDASGHLRAARRDDAEQASRLEPGARRRPWRGRRIFRGKHFSALLQPFFGWRILWILNLPTGLSLVLLGAFIPESAKFLLARGRREEARRVMERFGSKARQTRPAEQIALERGPSVALTGRAFFGKLFALSLAAICFSLINFGLLLWLPADLVAKGYSVGVSSKLLAESALIAFPTVFVVAYLYSRWSTKWSVVAIARGHLRGLVGVLWLELTGAGNPVLPVALLIIGTNALIAMLLPYTAESFPLRIRGRTTESSLPAPRRAACSPSCSRSSRSVPPLGVVSIAIMVPTIAALILVAWFGKETRGRDLRELDPDGHTFAATGM